MSRWVHLACVALLAWVSASLAEVVHHPTDFLLGDVWFPNEEFFELDVDDNGSVDFSLLATISYFSGITGPHQNRYLIPPPPPPQYRGGSGGIR